MIHSMEGGGEFEDNFCDSSHKFSPAYQRSGSLKGYTGYYPHHNQSIDELEQPCEKYMIRGYTGFRPFRRSAVGEPVVPSLEKQSAARSQYSVQENNSLQVNPSETASTHFRTYAKHVDLVERYNTAVEQLLERGQTQEMLLRILQTKMSERIHSYASQVIRARKVFEAFDVNGDNVLDENEFRICLEKLNIQLDDLQCLALFAYFDTNNDGFVEWKEFADFCMVQNPKGGSAVVPKMITTMAQTKDSDLSKIREIPNYLYHTKEFK